MKRLLAMILILFSLILQAAVCESETALTLMVYLCGSNLETEAGAASADLAEMMTYVPRDGSMRILVMPSGSKEWRTDISTDETAIYELSNDGLEQLCTLPAQSMGEPSALTALLDYGYTHAPAQRYALVMWDHGAGPNMGLCFDERYTTENGMDGLTLTELSAALAASPAAQTNLSWIGFDACLMASVETACVVAPYADYMIASQETEPATGWNYAFLTQAAEDVSGAETGRRVIDAYFESLADSMASVTLSCIDLRNLSAVSTAMDELFNGLHLDLNEQSYPDFADCRVNAKTLGYATSYEYDLIDLVDLLQLYQEEGVADCSALLSQLESTIVESRSNMPFINGLSIYYPHYGAEQEGELSPSVGYEAFIADMSAIRLGEPLTDWSQRYQPTAALEDGITQVSMALTAEQAQSLDTATLYIIKKMSGKDYQPVYRTNEVTLTDEHMLTATYKEQALFIVNAQGEAVSDALPYSLQGDAVVLNAMLQRSGDILEDDWYAFADLYFRQDEQGKYRLSEVRERTDDPMLQGKATLRLEDYETISIMQGSVTPVFAEDGSLLPPAQWPRGDMSYGWWFDMADFPGWSVDFLSRQDGRERYALLQMTDTQNQVIVSEMVAIPNPCITDIPVQQQTLVDNDTCCIRFIAASEVQGADPALRLLFTSENKDAQSIDVSTRTVQLDQTIVSHFSPMASAVEAGATETFEVEIRKETLEEMGVQSVEKVRLGLAVNRGYTEPIFEQDVEFTLAADLSVLAPEPVQHVIQATAEWDGLSFEIFDLSVDEDEYVIGQMRIRNLTDATVVMDTSTFYLNELELSGYLTGRIGTLTFPAGTTYHTGFRINTKAYLNENARPESGHCLLQAMGMTQLNTLAMNVYHDSWNEQSRVTFTLSQPMALPVEENLKRVDKWHVLYSKDGVTVYLADCTWEPDSEYQAQYRNINLLIDNTTDADVDIQIPMRSENFTPYMTVNGQQVRYAGTPVGKANSKCMEKIWYTVEDANDAIQTVAMALHITDANGRDDVVAVNIEALSEARTEDEYRVLDAEMMDVDVAVAD